MFIKTPEVIDPENPLFYYYHSNSHSISPYKKSTRKCAPRKRKKLYQISSKKSFVFSLLMFAFLLGYSYTQDKTLTPLSSSFSLAHHVLFSVNASTLFKENQISLSMSINNKSNKNMPILLKHLILFVNNTPVSLIEKPAIISVKKNTLKTYNYYVSMGKINLQKDIKIHLFVQTDNKEKKLYIPFSL